MNPMDEWVEGKYPDRRMPPQSALIELMRDLHSEFVATRDDRRVADERRAQVMARIEALEKAVSGLETKIEPMVEAMRVGRAMRMLIGAAVVMIGTAAASYAWLKQHVLAAIAR